MKIKIIKKFVKINLLKLLMINKYSCIFRDIRIKYVQFNIKKYNII